MARKHDLKARKVQLESLENKDEGEDVVILVKTKLRGHESFDTNTNALDYVMRKDIENSGDLIPIAPWINTEAVKLNQYRSHQIGAYEYLFRNLLDLNTNEPTLDGNALAWTYLGVDGAPELWNSGTTYQPFDTTPLFVYRDLGGGINQVYKSIEIDNLNNTPETSPEFWEDIGQWKSPYDPEETYDVTDFVVDLVSPFKNYISNTNGNTYLFNETIPGTKTWQVIGYTPNGSANKGSFPSTDTGQSVINIPHGLTGIPEWFSVQGTNVISIGVINKSDLTIDATNIIITPEFMNNDGSTLNFLWKAEL